MGLQGMVPLALLLLIFSSMATSALAERQNDPASTPHDAIATIKTNSKKEPKSSDPVDYIFSKYLTNAEVAAHLEGFTKRCGSISRLVKLGTSVKGEPLLALEISDNPGQAEAEPNVKLVGGIHGNEPGGLSLTLALAEWLCASYQTDPTAAKIVRDSHIWLFPIMNPDGYASKVRENAAGIDLNRDFPDRFAKPPFTSPKGIPRQPETAAVMKWSKDIPFVSSLAFHQGALVVNYPWDTTATGESVYSASPDDKTFRYLAKTYAKHHVGMTGPDNSEFPTGITNGAAWYNVYGAMQDWNYVKARCMELTIELGPKLPPVSELRQNYEDARWGVVKFIKTTAFGGIRGRVLTSKQGVNGTLSPVGGAEIFVKGVAWPVTSKPKFGDYYRPIAPGIYTLEVRKTGYKVAKAVVKVPATGAGVTQNFVLQKVRRA